MQTATLTETSIQLSTGESILWTEDDHFSWGWIAAQNLLTAAGWELVDAPNGQQTLAVRRVE